MTDGYHFAVILPIAANTGRVPENDTEEPPAWLPSKSRPSQQEKQRADLTKLLGHDALLNPLVSPEGLGQLRYRATHAQTSETTPVKFASNLSLTVVIAPDDHRLQRVHNEERHTPQSFAVLTGFAPGKRKLDRPLWEDENYRKEFNDLMRNARLPASIFPQGFVTSEAVTTNNPVIDPSPVLGELHQALQVTTETEDGQCAQNAIEHVAEIHLALLALRQDCVLRGIEYRTRTLRTRHDRNDEALRWSGLRTGAALEELADMGSALSTFRSELWTEHLPRWQEGQEVLRHLQTQLSLPARLDNLEKITSSWAASLSISQARTDQVMEAEAARRRETVEQALAAVAVAAVVLSVAALFVDPANPSLWPPILGVAATAAACILAWIWVRSYQRQWKSTETADTRRKQGGSNTLPGRPD